MRKINQISTERLRALLDYDPETGVLRCRIGRHGIAAGKVVGCLGPDGYLRCRIDGRSFLVHRLIYQIHHGRAPDNQIDHINGIRTDNGVSNLREATSRENNQNSRAKKRGLKGVEHDRRHGRFYAKIRFNNRRIYLGCFKTEAEAHNAYYSAARQYFGEFARAG